MSDKITIDWKQIKNEEDFYKIILPQMRAPNWHGHNLDALNDSWVTGGICDTGPPFQFEFTNVSKIEKKLSNFVQTIFDIATDSLASNGGTLSVDKSPNIKLKEKQRNDLFVWHPTRVCSGPPSGLRWGQMSKFLANPS